MFIAVMYDVENDVTEGAFGPFISEDEAEHFVDVALGVRPEKGFQTLEVTDPFALINEDVID